MYKGINQDVHPRYNTGGYNYALNVNTEDTERALKYSDFSNEFCVDFKAKILGHCHDKDNNYIVFLSNNSIVRFFPLLCTFETLYQNDDLKFGNWIECVYTILRGCEELVYFTDGVNKYRVINLDRLNQIEDINDLNYNLAIGTLDITGFVHDGGSLNAGAYFFTYRIVDSAGTPSNFSTIYPPVYVSDDNARYNDIDKVKTSKSITFELDESLVREGYSFQIAVIEYSNHSKATSSVYLLPENSKTFTGTNYVTTSTALNLIVDKLIVDVVNTHTKLHNRLFVGNMQTEKFYWDRVQKLANLIPVYYKTTAKLKTLTESSFRSFRHSDVYDFGIMGIYANGKTTPVFHIPGRTKDPVLTPFTMGPGPNSGVQNNIDTRLVSNVSGPVTIRSTCNGYCEKIMFSYKVTSANIVGGKIVFTIAYSIDGLSEATIDTNFVYGTFETLKSTFTTGINGKIVSDEFDYVNSNQVVIEIYIYTSQCKYIINLSGTDVEDTITVRPFNTEFATLPNWQLTNTALKHISPIAGVSSGLMAYFEACELYPDDTDCSNIPIFPHDVIEVNGTNVYKMHPIRYHRMPDQVLEPIEDANYVYTVQPHFDLQQFYKDIKSVYSELDKNIVKWQIVYGERLNPMVKDSGLLMSSYSGKRDFKDLYFSDLGVEPDDIYATVPTNFDQLSSIKAPGEKRDRFYGGDLDYEHTIKLLYSPSIIVENKLFKGVIHINKKFFTRNGTDIKFLASKKHSVNTHGDITKHDQWWAYNLYGKGIFNAGDKYLFPTDHARLVAPIKHTDDSDGSEYIGVKDTLNGQVVRNMLYSSNVAFYKASAFNIPSNRISPTYNYSVDIISFNEPYTFETTTYHELNDGDTWIAPFSFSIKSTAYLPSRSLNIGVLDWIRDGVGKDIAREVYNKLAVRMYIEHDINMDYRFQGVDSYKAVLKHTSNAYKTFLDSDRKKIGGGTEEDAIYEYFPDFQKYSQDYSLAYGQKPYRKLARHYDYCSDCAECVPNRIYYSDASNIDNNIDHLRSIRVNNYTMLEEDINTLFRANDDLFARTTKYIYNIPTKQVEIKTDSFNAYIGPRELFGIPPVKLGSVDYLFGGSVQKLDFANTEGGVFFSGNHLMKYTNTLGTVEEGLRSFLRNNFAKFDTIHSNDAYRDYRSISNFNRMYNLCYDYMHNRLFISKNEYLILPQYKNDVRFINNEPYIVKGDVSIPILFSDTRYFINSSFNISYSLANDAFVSFHSWIPDYTMFDSRAYYSLKGTELWKHLDTTSNTKRLTYYGKTYPMIIDIPLQAKGNQTSMWDSVMYRQDLTNSELMPRRDVLGNKTTGVMNTFTHYVAYNDVQSTGLIPLVLKQNIFDPSNLSQVENRFNFIIGREMALNDKILDWNIVEERRDIMLLTDNEFEDKLFPSNNLNNIRAFNQARLRDDYMNLRLIYDPNLFVDYNYILNKLNLDIVDSNTTISLPK